MSLRTPIGRARGLGSAKEGTHHWWHERLTAIALIPLCIWFAISLVWLAGASYAEVVAWLAEPVPAAMMLLLIGFGLYHLKLGMQVVIEDYVSTEWMKLAGIIVVSFWCLALGLACVMAVLHIWLGA